MLLSWLVALQAGGVVTATPSSMPSSCTQLSCCTAEQCVQGSAGASHWHENSQGLCRDVHAIVRDPFTSKRSYAVCGSGNLPGGVYRSRGNKWKRLFGYR